MVNPESENAVAYLAQLNDPISRPRSNRDLDLCQFPEIVEQLPGEISLPEKTEKLE